MLGSSSTPLITRTPYLRMFETLIDQLRRNEPRERSGTIEIDWHVDHHMEYRELLQELRLHGECFGKSSFITSINACVPLDQDFQDLLSAFASLQSLVRLTFSRTRHRIFMVTSLDTIFRILEPRLLELESLQIYIPVLVTLHERFQSSSYLELCSKLHTFECTDISNIRNRPVDELIQALLYHKNLRRLHLGLLTYTESPLISYETVRTICTSSTLESLALQNFGINDKMIIEMTKYLQKNDTFRLIDLRRNWQITNSGLLHIYRMMRHQMHIEEFRLVEGMGLREEDRDFAYESACSNDSLNQRSLAGKIESFTRMNKLSRRKVFRQTQAGTQYLDLIHAVSKDIDAIYYLCTANPEICSAKEYAKAPKTTRRKRKHGC